MYLDFPAKVLSLQWISKEITFSNVYPRSAGDKLRRLSVPTEFISLDSLLSIQEIFCEKLNTEELKKEQEPAGRTCRYWRNDFSIAFFVIWEFLSQLFLYSLAVDQTRCHIFQFDRHRFRPRDGQVYSVELSFFGFSRVVPIGNDEAFLS